MCHHQSQYQLKLMHLYFADVSDQIVMGMVDLNTNTTPKPTLLKRYTNREIKDIIKLPVKLLLTFEVVVEILQLKKSVSNQE